MDELKIYRRKGAGAAAASADRYQNLCDQECISLVNNREWSRPPMATMEYTAPVVTRKKRRLTPETVFVAATIITVGVGIGLALSGCLLAGTACAVAATGLMILAVRA